MKLRFRVGSKQARKNGDIEALADAMRALKNDIIYGTTLMATPPPSKKENLELKLRSLFFLKMSHLIQAQAMG